MRTDVQPTSLDAFAHLKATRILQEQEILILSAMRPNTLYTRRQLSELTHLETATVSGRINGLLGSHVEIVGTVKDTQTNRTVGVLMLKVAA